MTKSIRLLGIAPYEELNQSMTAVSKEFEQVNIDIFTADLQQGQALAEQLMDQDYDAIISRGGTAHLIEQVVDIPVIDVSISIYDILSAIKLANNYSNNIAIVGYASITKTAHLICDILQYAIKIVTVDSPEQAAQVLQELVADAHDLILCDAITNQIALSKAINTLLITSGVESITAAFHQAITYVQQLQRTKQENELLRYTLQNQSHKFIILTADNQVFLSNIEPSLEKSTQHFLKQRHFSKKSQQLYHTHQSQVYQLKTREIPNDQQNFLLCELRQVTPPIINQSFGLQFHNHSDIEESISKHLLFASFIQEKNKELMKSLLKHYKAMMIFGENGTAKTSLAYSAFLTMQHHTDNLITIEARLFNERLWKYLTHTNNGLFLETGNTFLLKNVEQLSQSDCEQIITFIKDSHFLQRNNLLLTYNSNSSHTETDIFNYIMTELDCSSLYSPSITERQNELTSIITLFLNKLNIECNTKVIGFDPKAMKILQDFTWTGNLYQLERVIKTLVLQAKTYYISENSVSEVLTNERRHQNSIPMQSQPQQLLPHLIKEKTLFDYSQDIVLAVLAQNKGNQTKTAKQLGISRTTLWRYLKLND